MATDERWKFTQMEINFKSNPNFGKIHNVFKIKRLMDVDQKVCWDGEMEGDGQTRMIINQKPSISQRSNSKSDWNQLRHLDVSIALLKIAVTLG